MQFFLYNICCFNKIHTTYFPLSLSTIIQNFKQISKSTTELGYNIFFKFKMAAVCYIGFLITWFWTIGHLGLCFPITVPNLVQKCCSTPNYWPKSKSRMAAVRHIGFPKIWFLSTGTPWAANFPSLYQIWCKNVDRCRNYGQKSKSKMAAVRSLGFVTSS